MNLRWGIAGVSKIAHDFCVALQSNLTESKHLVIAIASRTKVNAKEFARLHGIDQYYGSYKDLAKNPNVEVVYIAVLNPMHFEVCKLMIEHGKHIVCEKPFCMNYWQVNEVLNLARREEKFAMEGLWSRFFPVYRHLAHLIDTNSIGNVKEIYVKHGFQGTKTNRIVRKELGGGILLDIGVYAIQFVLFVFRDEPTSIKATGKTNSSGVDLYFEAELTFSGGRKAKLICSGLEECENQATIISTKGPICIQNYWCPTKLIAFNRIQNWPLCTSDTALHYTNTLGLKYQADEVMKTIRSGNLECGVVPHKEMLLIAKVEDEIRRQIGVTYPWDKIPI